MNIACEGKIKHSVFIFCSLLPTAKTEERIRHLNWLPEICLRHLWKSTREGSRKLPALAMISFSIL